MALARDMVIILDELQAWGFSDEAFYCLHHFQEAGRSDTIAAHLRYCERTKTHKKGKAATLGYASLFPE